jgi:hypothetical protein
VAVVDIAGITLARSADEPAGRSGFRCDNAEEDRWLHQDAVAVDRLPGFRVTAARDGTREVGCYLLTDGRPADTYLGLFVPMALVFIIDRGKGVRETLPATLTCGVAFAITQFVTSSLFAILSP